MSMRAELPWGTCNNEWNTPECTIRNATINCTQFHELFRNFILNLLYFLLTV